MNTTTEQPKSTTNPYADPAGAVKAIVDTGKALCAHAAITTKEGQEDNGKLLTRDVWFNAVKNALASQAFTRSQVRTIKWIRDRVRATKPKALQ